MDGLSISNQKGRGRNSSPKTNVLLLTCDAWELTGFHRALYEYHAQKAREIADKCQAAIGYDYDKALEKCRKKKTKNKDGRDSDIGGEALELLLR